MRIELKTLGAVFSVEVEEGCTYTEALETFERVTGKLMNNLDIFIEGGGKVSDLSSPIEGEGDQTWVGVKSKHESAVAV